MFLSCLLRNSINTPVFKNLNLCRNWSLLVFGFNTYTKYIFLGYRSSNFIDEECWIYTWTCNLNDIRIAENQATRWWTTTSYKIETKSWPNKKKKISRCCRFCARLQLQYSKFKFQQILSQNSTTFMPISSTKSINSITTGEQTFHHHHLVMVLMSSWLPRSQWLPQIHSPWMKSCLILLKSSPNASLGERQHSFSFTVLCPCRFCFSSFSISH